MRRASSAAESTEAACVGLSGGTEPCGGDTVCFYLDLEILLFALFLLFLSPLLSTRDLSSSTGMSEGCGVLCLQEGKGKHRNHNT